MEIMQKHKLLWLQNNSAALCVKGNVEPFRFLFKTRILYDFNIFSDLN